MPHASTVDASATQPQDRLVAPDAVRDVPLHLVLVEPQIPPNAGNVARLCAATGCALHLVEPLGFRIDDRELKRAGLDYWDALGVVVHPSLEAFLAAFAPERLWLLSTRAERTYAQAPFARGDALVFGKETAGLPQALLDAHPERALRIPMRSGAVRSLNLSTAVGIVTYAALERLGFPELS
ncbi:MAG: tRNA (cytidine/uridine-2-O-)-methyltransferase [Candidatus Eremiobacteraeota bacterium]|nr:tRNA (cytidine/uridine-2-O-)-methyltransferase [Candidatus Eremiobacteraeota bacterium]